MDVIAKSHCLLSGLFPLPRSQRFTELKIHKLLNVYEISGFKLDDL